MKQQVNIIFAETAVPINVSVLSQVIATKITKEGLHIDGRTKVHGTIKGIRTSNSDAKQNYNVK